MVADRRGIENRGSVENGLFRQRFRKTESAFSTASRICSEAVGPSNPLSKSGRWFLSHEPSRRARRPVPNGASRAGSSSRRQDRNFCQNRASGRRHPDRYTPGGRVFFGRQRPWPAKNRCPRPSARVNVKLQRCSSAASDIQHLHPFSGPMQPYSCPPQVCKQWFDITVIEFGCIPVGIFNH